jgi:hypothetical protein
MTTELSEEDKRRARSPIIDVWNIFFLILKPLSRLYTRTCRKERKIMLRFFNAIIKDKKRNLNNQKGFNDSLLVVLFVLFAVLLISERFLPASTLKNPQRIRCQASAFVRSHRRESTDVSWRTAEKVLVSPACGRLWTRTTHETFPTLDDDYGGLLRKRRCRSHRQQAVESERHGESSCTVGF